MFSILFKGEYLFGEFRGKEKKKWCQTSVEINISASREEELWVNDTPAGYIKGVQAWPMNVDLLHISK